jgi:small-conductance mechanosensitive channel
MAGDGRETHRIVFVLLFSVLLFSCSLVLLFSCSLVLGSRFGGNADGSALQSVRAFAHIFE